MNCENGGELKLIGDRPCADRGELTWVACFERLQLHERRLPCAVRMSDRVPDGSRLWHPEVPGRTTDAVQQRARGFLSRTK
jgi:hypothetical protein